MANILIVDDEVDIRIMLKKMLERENHDVSLAENGKVAVKLIEETQPDILITDLIMPEKEGIETILEVRKKYPDIKIIAISGGGRLEPTDYLKFAKTAGARYTLTKPFTHDELFLAVNDLLE